MTAVLPVVQGNSAAVGILHQQHVYSYVASYHEDRNTKMLLLSFFTRCLQFSSTLCKTNSPYPTDSSSKLCHYLPVVQEQIDLAINTLLWCNSYICVLALATACAGSWQFWELAYVEKKAAKHKRRRKQRKNAIPWDKIKVRVTCFG